MAVWFDYSEIATRLGLAEADLHHLEAAVRRVTGHDEMMYELRMLRTLRAIEGHHVSIQDAIADFECDSPRTTTRVSGV